MNPSACSVMVTSPSSAEPSSAPSGLRKFVSWPAPGWPSEICSARVPSPSAKPGMQMVGSALLAKVSVLAVNEPLTGPGGAGTSPAQSSVVVALAMKLTNAVDAPPAVTKLQEVPLQAPPQPMNLEDASGCAVSVSAVPTGKAMLHEPGQSIPAGMEVTRPEPVPLKLTVMTAIAGG